MSSCNMPITTVWQEPLEKTSCFMCLSDAHRVLCRRPDRSIIVQCRSCKQIYVNPRPSQKEIKSLYQKSSYYKKESLTDITTGYTNYIAEQQKVLASTDNIWKRRLSMISSHSSPGKLLDIGCAAGSFLAAAKKIGWQINGIDVSPHAVEYAKKHFNIDVTLGSPGVLPYPDASFNVVTMWDIIEHLEFPQELIKEVWRVLTPNGMIWISTPNFNVFFLEREKWTSLHHSFEHICYFTPKNLTAIFKKTGFNKTGWLTETDPETPRSRFWQYVVGNNRLDALGFGHVLIMWGNKS